MEWLSTKWNENVMNIVTGFQHLNTGPQNQVSHLKIVPTTPKLSICNHQNIWQSQESEKSQKYADNNT